MTIDDLSMVDMFFQPNYDQPLNYINALAMEAVAKADSKK
jgi:NADH oxidase (H2O-forming)